MSLSRGIAFPRGRTEAGVEVVGLAFGTCSLSRLRPISGAIRKACENAPTAMQGLKADKHRVVTCIKPYSETMGALSPMPSVLIDSSLQRSQAKVGEWTCRQAIRYCACKSISDKSPPICDCAPSEAMLDVVMIDFYLILQGGRIYIEPALATSCLPTLPHYA